MAVSGHTAPPTATAQTVREPTCVEAAVHELIAPVQQNLAEFNLGFASDLHSCLLAAINNNALIGLTPASELWHPSAEAAPEANCEE